MSIVEKLFQYPSGSGSGCDLPVGKGSGEAEGMETPALP